MNSGGLGIICIPSKAYASRSKAPCNSERATPPHCQAADEHIKFPYVTANFGKPAPLGSLVGKNEIAARGISEIHECLPDLWVSVDRGKPAPKMFEQVMNQRDGYAMTLLWIEDRSEDDEEEFDREENLTSAQRYRDRIHRSSR